MISFPHLELFGHPCCLVPWSKFLKLILFASFRDVFVSHIYLLLPLMRKLMRNHCFRKHYSAGPAELSFNGKPTSVKDLELIFDSGSSYTYFNSQAYQAIVDLVGSKPECLNYIVINFNFNFIVLSGLKLNNVPSLIHNSGN